MSQFRDDIVATEVVPFWFAANETTGTAGDGASALFDVRLAGGAAGDAPTASGSPTLLTHANYSPGLYEILIDTTGYANGEYAVFCTLTISTVNPAGFVGSFRVRTANRIDGLVTAVADLPTNAELATALGTADDAVLAAIADLPTNAELATALGTADDAVLAAIADLPTNAELATALGTADDAVLAVLGTPAGLTMSADIAAMKVDTAAILVDTAEIGAAGAGLTNINLPNQTMDIVGNITGNLSGSVGSVTGAVGSVTGAVGSVTGLTASDVGAIKTKTDSLTFTKALEVDANIQSINGTTVIGDGGATPWGP